MDPCRTAGLTTVEDHVIEHVARSLLDLSGSGDYNRIFRLSRVRIRLARSTRVTRVCSLCNRSRSGHSMGPA
jgi:hypothetical protein